MMGIGLAVLSATASWANERPGAKRALLHHSNESGVTVGDVLELNIWQLARNPLSPETLSRVSVEVHRPPRRGVQFELLTPGDFGATIHFRW